MATVFLSHSLTNTLLSRNQAMKTKINLKKCSSFSTKCSHVSSNSGPSTSQNEVCRRDLMLFGFCSSLALILPLPEASAEEEINMATMVDDVNAYSYLYPIELPSKKVIFKWVESRKPERYSSAAPLSPDARLRIVSERLDFVDNLVISVSIVPPNLQLLKSADKSKWAAKDVADAILADKSAVRVTSAQRMEESSVLDAHCVEVDGEPYWYYEYLVRKSPTKNTGETNNFRHYVASTVERDGYLYSLNASTLNKQWNVAIPNSTNLFHLPIQTPIAYIETDAPDRNQMGALLNKTVASFHLLPPTENYVSPSTEPWRFW